MRRVLLALSTAVAMVAALLSLTAIPASAQLVIDMGVTVSDDLDPVVAGDTITYTVTVKNHSLLTAPAGSVTLHDVQTGGTITDISGEGACSGSGNTWTCTFNDIPGDKERTVTVKVTAPGGGEAVNEATLDAGFTDLNDDNDYAKEKTTVKGISDLEITSFTDTPDPVSPQGEVIESVTVTNTGPKPAASVTLVLETDGTIFDAGTCTETASSAVSCDLGSIGAGSSVTREVWVTAPATGTSFSTAATATLNDADNVDPDGASGVTHTGIADNGATALGPNECASFVDDFGHTQRSCAGPEGAILTAFHSTPGGTDANGSVVGPGVRVDVHDDGGPVEATLVINHDACRGVGNDCIQLGWREAATDLYKLVESCPGSDPKAPCEISRARIEGGLFTHEVSVPADPDIGPLKFG